VLRIIEFEGAVKVKFTNPSPDLDIATRATGSSEAPRAADVERYGHKHIVREGQSLNRQIAVIVDKAGIGCTTYRFKPHSLWE
jgi:hypothetical protein